jgi:hypothetical protein
MSKMTPVNQTEPEEVFLMRLLAKSKDFSDSGAYSQKTLNDSFLSKV